MVGASKERVGDGRQQPGWGEFAFLPEFYRFCSIHLWQFLNYLYPPKDYLFFVLI
jgi:hypothetical protein